MSGIERCPHCVATPMAPFTNGWGGVYLTCLDCGYSESVVRKPDPMPTKLRKYVSRSGEVRWKARHFTSKKKPGARPRRVA